MIWRRLRHNSVLAPGPCEVLELRMPWAHEALGMGVARWWQLSLEIYSQNWISVSWNCGCKEIQVLFEMPTVSWICGPSWSWSMFGREMPPGFTAAFFYIAILGNWGYTSILIKNDNIVMWSVQYWQFSGLGADRHDLIHGIPICVQEWHIQCAVWYKTKVVSTCLSKFRPTLVSYL